MSWCYLFNFPSDNDTMSKNKNEPINFLSLSSAHTGASKPPLPRGIIPKSGQVICGNIDMYIDRNGNWYHQGSPIGRIELVRLFASVLKRDDDGNYWLITPAEMARIAVEDAPFLAVELFRTGDGTKQSLSLRTNLDAIITIDERHPIRITINYDTGEPTPYVVLDGTIEAKISRAVYYELVSLCVEKHHGSEILGVWSEEIFFPFGSLGATL